MKKKFNNKPRLSRSTNLRWLKVVSRSPENQYQELVIAYILPRAAMVLEAVAEAEEEMVSQELMNKEIKSLIKKRERAVVSRVNQEAIIHLTSNLVLAEELESLMRRRAVMEEETGAASQIARIRGDKSMKVFQRAMFHQRSLKQRKLPPHQKNQRLRNQKSQTQLRRKLSLVSVLTIS